jgi:hypothetical protein
MSVRPRSIIWFERIQYSILGLGLINVMLTWNQQLARAASIGQGAGWVIGVLAGSLGIPLLLMWLIAYRGSKVAKWVLVVMTGLGFPAMVALWRTLAQNGSLSLVITSAQSALALVSLWMLFRPDTRDWFAGRRPMDPEIFR